MKKMINTAEFRNAYEKFYTEMRNYLWDFSTLQLLADVEVATYQSFLDLKELKKKLDRLHPVIKEIAEDDEYLKEAYDDFYKLIEDNEESTMYFTLYQVEEA